MFGNKINYTQSPGGIRRGLVYQSSNMDKGVYINGNVISTQAYFSDILSGINSNAPNIELSKNGNVYLRLKHAFFGNAGGTNFPKDRFTLYSNWYPIYFFNCYKITLQGRFYDLSELPNYITIDQQLLIKKETLTITGYDNTYYNQDYVVLYYNISNVNIITVNNKDYYDIGSAESSSGDYHWIFNNGKIKWNIFERLNFSMEGETKYFTDIWSTLQYFPNPQGGTSQRPTGFNNLNTGKSYVEGYLKYERRTTSQYDRLVPIGTGNDNGYTNVRLTGNSPITVYGDYRICPIFYGCSPTIGAQLYNYDITTKQVLNVSTNFQKGLSTSDPSVSTRFYYETSQIWNYDEMIMRVSCNNFMCEYSNTAILGTIGSFGFRFRDYSDSITLNNFDEVFISNLTPN